MRWLHLNTVLTSIAWLFPAAALAQTISLGQALDHQDGSPVDLILYTTVEMGMTTFQANFDGTITDEDSIAANASEHNFELNERAQRLTHIAPQFGVRWYLLDELSIKGSVGVSWMRLEQETITLGAVGSTYFDTATTDRVYSEFAAFQSNPGFSAMLGADYEFVKLERISAKAGLQISYMSSTGLSGHKLSGNGTVTSSGGSTQFDYDEVNTTDIALHLFNIQPHVGIEWRPFRSYIVNSFGLYGSLVLSASSLDAELVSYDIAGGTTNTDTLATTEVSVGFSPKQYLGAYYAWYVGIPHFGNLGVELQFGARTAGSISYQYQF